MRLNPRSTVGPVWPAALGRAGLLAAVLAATTPRFAWAHEGAPPQPHDLWSAWDLEPTIILPLVLTGAVYMMGVRELWRRAGQGRGIRPWRVWAFSTGLATILLALISPIDALGSALFSAHMFQHMLLILVAAPLVLLGAPLQPLFWALPATTRRRLGGWWLDSSHLRGAWHLLSGPILAWGLHALALWAWHLPALYQAALEREAVHMLEHASFFGTALLFWWPVVRPDRHARLHPGLAVLYLFTMSFQGGLLGALMTFSGSPWYPAYAGSVGSWGLTPLEDQQLGGLIMWIPAGLVYVAAALATLAVWLGPEDYARAPGTPATDRSW